MRLVPVKYLKEHTQIAIDIIGSDGKLLLKEGQKVTQGMINGLNKLGISSVYIQDKYCFSNEAYKYTMDLTNIYRSIEKLREIARRVEKGTSGAIDIIDGRTIASEIIDELFLCQGDFKIVYEPNKMIVDTIVEQTIYVAIMATALGLKMNFNKEKLIKLCLAVLVRDIALLSPKIQLDDKDSYRLHPVLSYKYLKANYGCMLDQEILDAVLHHHELFDGSGYPNRLNGEEICEFARIIGIIDSFYELKSNHDMINDSQELFDIKLKNILKKFDVKILSYFIKNTELFTLDTLVRLNNDDIAVVVKNNYSNPFKPVVRIIKSNIYAEGEIIELQHNLKLRIKNIEYYVED